MHIMNIITPTQEQYFDAEELQYMNDEIKSMYDSEICPIGNPIPLPVIYDDVKPKMCVSYDV